MASLQKPSSEGTSDSGCGCQENKRLPQALGFGPVSHNPITDRLKHMEMSQLATKNVLTVTTHTSLQEATIKMVENFVSSVPVYDPQENRCIGTVSLLDIATYIARNVAPEVPREEKCHPKVELLKQEPVKNVMNLSGRGPFVLLDIDGGSFPVFDLLSRGLHRVLLQNRSGDVSWNVSQSDLVAKIYQLRYEKDISEMLCSINVSAFYNSKSEQNLVSATSDIPVIDAVRLLVEQGVSAVPVVSSKDGTLVGNFSASDIRGLFALPARQWNMPVEQYLYEYSRPSLTPYVVRNDSTNLGAILEYLVNEHLHHLWIVNEHSRPIACVSLTDVLRVIRDHKHSASTSTSASGGAGVKSTSGAAGAGMSQETIEAFTR